MSPPCVIYAAKSTSDLKGSIPDQLADGRKLAAARGFEVVAEHQDEAASAYHGDRGPGLAAALTACERLSAEHGSCALIVQHSDRLARGDAKQARHLIEVVLWAIKSGVQLLSVQDPEMLAGGDMALLLGAIGGMRNHQDSKRKGLAVKGGIRRRAVERRQFIGGRRPFGYRHRDSTPEGGSTGPLVIDQAEAVIIRRIFSEYLAGVSQRQIAIDLNEAHVPTLTGATWYATTVAGMLRNPLYKGWITHNGESFPGPDGQPAHEPIVDDETWEQARQLRESMHRSPGGGRGRKPRGSHLFTNGLLRCSCGAPMSPVTKPTRTPGRLYEVYTCARRLHHGPSACGQPPVKRDVIDVAVWRFFERVALDVEATREVIAKQARAQLSEHGILREQAGQELLRVETAHERIEGDYIAGKITAEQWAGLQAKLADQIAAARGQVEQHERQRQAISDQIAAFDAEQEVYEQLAAIRAQLAGEARHASEQSLPALRMTLHRLFAGFELVGPSQPFGTGGLDGDVWAPQREDDDLRVGHGYVLMPYVRAEALDTGPDADYRIGSPAVERGALPLHDSLCARLAAW
jgi:DNA invertase Pin-like site-specific DNA recombinase